MTTTRVPDGPATLTPEQASRDRRYNFIACMIDACGWPLGISFFSTTTLVPLFMSHLGAGNFLIGLLPALVSLGYNLPGVFVAGRIARLDHVRPWLFTVALLERLPLLAFALLMFAWGASRPGPTLVLFFLAYGLHALMLGINQPAYWVAVGKVIPMQRRGRMFGYGGVLAGLLGFAVDPITRHFLGGPHGGFPNGFAWCFLIGAVIQFVSFLPLGVLREPPSATPAVASRPVWESARAVWSENSGFRRFLWGQVAFGVWSIATPFYLLDSIRKFHAGAGLVAEYTAVGVVLTAFSGLGWGLWSDKKGNRIVLLAAVMAGVVGSAYALIAPSASAYLLVFSAVALATSGTNLAGYNILMEFAPTERDISLYTSVFNFAVSITRAIALLAGGWISDKFGFGPVFAISSAFALVAFLLTLRVVEPRHVNRFVTLEGHSS